MEQPDILFAGVDIAIIAISIGISLLAAELLKQQNKALAQDDKPTTLATRGTFLQRLMGRRRTGYVFCAAGARGTTKERAGGKNALFGAFGPKTEVFREKGWHALCIGPAFCLWSIEQSGAKIFTGPITRISHPSGSTIDVGNEGEFQIYWGQNGVANGQPINTDLGTLLDKDPLGSGTDPINSSWPYVCYVFWTNKRLGPSPNWPVITYTLETRPQSAILSDTPGYIPPTQVLNPLGLVPIPIIGVNNATPGTAYFEVAGDGRFFFKPKMQIQVTGNTGLGVDTDYTIAAVIYLGGFPNPDATRVFTNETISGATVDGGILRYRAESDDGWNGAHAIAELLFEPWPYGLGRPTSGTNAEVDMQSLEDLGTLLVAENFRGSWMFEREQDLEGVLAGIHQDLGVMWPINFRTGLLTYVPIRVPTGMIPDIPFDAQTVPPEITTIHGSRPTDRVVYSFSDEENQFREMTIGIDDAGQASFQQFFRQRVVQIVSTTNFGVASLMANRRSLEDLSQKSDIRLSTNRGARFLLPGSFITADGFSELLMINNVQTDTESGQVELSVIPNFYGIPLSNFKQPTANTGSGGIPVEPDVGFAILEVPEILTGANGPVTVIVVRIRAHQNISGSEIHISPDDTTFIFQGLDTTIMSGGTLDEPLLADGEYEVDIGPEFTAEGVDIASTLDLSTNISGWRSGLQIAYLVNPAGESEVIFLQRIENISGNTYRMRGLIRARYDSWIASPGPATGPKEFLAGTRMFILEQTEGLAVQDQTAISTVITYAKSAPQGVGTIPLNFINSENLDLYGKGQRPLPVSGIRLDTGAGVVGAGNTLWIDFFYRLVGTPSALNDLDVVWAYSTPQAPGTGAGQQGAGVSVIDPAPEGPFRVDILDAGNVAVRSDTVLFPSYTYTEADRLSDFGASEPALFKVRVTQVRGGFQSDSVVQTFTRIP